MDYEKYINIKLLSCYKAMHVFSRQGIDIDSPAFSIVFVSEHFA